MLFLLSVTALNAEVPGTMKANDTDLLLNGSGIRTKLFQLYIAALYLENKNSDADSIINNDKPMAIRLEILSGLITADKMEEATRDGFDKSTKGNIAPISTEIEGFLEVFKEQIDIGDIFEFVNIPGVGVVISKNGVKKNTLTGIEFKKALFGIWLCDKPAQKRLKRQMLGQ